jgi:hypothetical protein
VSHDPQSPPGAKQTPRFRPSRPTLLRDLAVVLACAALVAGFAAQVWRAPEPPGPIAARAAASLHLVASGR